MPLEALYNTKIDTLKQIEEVSEQNPSPLTISVYKEYDREPNHTLVRIQNEDRNIMMEYDYFEGKGQKKVYRSYKEK